MAFPRDRLTDRAIHILSLAEKSAQDANLDEVHPEHILYALAAGERGTARMALEATGVDITTFINDIPLPPARPARKVRPARLSLNAEATHALAYAKEEGTQLEHHHIGTEHLLLGVLRLPNSPASKFLLGHNITVEMARQSIASLLKGNPDGV